MHAGALQGRASAVLANRGDRNFIGFAGECLTVCVECAKVRRRRSRRSGLTLCAGRSGSSGLAFQAGRPRRSNCSGLAFRAGRPRFAFCSGRSSFAAITFDPLWSGWSLCTGLALRACRSRRSAGSLRASRSLRSRRPSRPGRAGGTLLSRAAEQQVASGLGGKPSSRLFVPSSRANRLVPTS